MLFNAVVLSLVFAAQSSVPVGASCLQLDPEDDAPEQSQPSEQPRGGLEEQMPAIEQIFAAELNGDLLVDRIVLAVLEADPVGESDQMDDTERLRPGQVSDFAKAFVAVPQVKAFFDRIEATATAKVRAEPDKVTLLTLSLTFGASVLSSASLVPALHRPAQDVLNLGGNDLLHKALPWLSFQFDLVSAQKSFSMTIDLIQLLRQGGVHR